MPKEVGEPIPVSAILAQIAYWRGAGSPEETKPIEDNTENCKRLFLQIKERDYPWLAWMISDLQIAVIVDAMEAWRTASSSQSEVFSRPECPFNYCDTKAPHTECATGCRHAEKV